jgi:uncharacterized protein with HEPN domain
VSRDPALYLDDIEDAGSAIGRFVAGVSFDQFAANDEKRSAVERQVFIIGEAASRLPEAHRGRAPEVPWREIIGLRNILAHGYWRIEAAELWDVATREVPSLLASVRRLRASIG